MEGMVFPHVQALHLYLVHLFGTHTTTSLFPQSRADLTVKGISLVTQCPLMRIEVQVAAPLNSQAKSQEKRKESTWIKGDPSVYINVYISVGGVIHCYLMVVSFPHQTEIQKSSLISHLRKIRLKFLFDLLQILPEIKESKNVSGFSYKFIVILFLLYSLSHICYRFPIKICVRSLELFSFVNSYVTT